jgi:hypothetical protein
VWAEITLCEFESRLFRSLNRKEQNNKMTIMHIFPLSVIMVILGITMIAVWAEENKWKTKIIMSSIMLILLSWLTAFIMQPTVIKSTEILTPYEVALPNGQVIQSVSYLDENGKPKTVNLNEKFKFKIMPGVKIKMSRPMTGPYCGISMIGLDAANDIFELAD